MKKKVEMKNIRDYEHYDKQRSPKELEDHIDSRYNCESELMISLMFQAIGRFNIKTFYELAITNESLLAISSSAKSCFIAYCLSSSLLNITTFFGDRFEISFTN